VVVVVAVVRKLEAVGCIFKGCADGMIISARKNELSETGRTFERNEEHPIRKSVATMSHMTSAENPLILCMQTHHHRWQSANLPACTGTVQYRERYRTVFVPGYRTSCYVHIKTSGYRTATHVPHVHVQANTHRCRTES